MSHPSPGPNSRHPKLNQDLEDVKKKKKTESSAMEITIDWILNKINERLHTIEEKISYLKVIIIEISQNKIIWKRKMEREAMSCGLTLEN